MVSSLKMSVFKKVFKGSALNLKRRLDLHQTYYRCVIFKLYFPFSLSLINKLVVKWRVFGQFRRYKCH